MTGTVVSDATVDLLEELVRRPSVTPQDAGCQQLMRERLETLGFECESMRFGEVDNLWARRGTTGPLFCFAGHTDVVPPGELARWSSEPFVPEIRDGKLYGRGAADMKGSIAAFLVALERFVHTHPAHAGSIALLITSDEEGPARDGTKRVIEKLNERQEKIDWCLVGEPSSQRTVGDMIRIGRRGSLTGRLTVFGTAGHVAYPQLADNPIVRFAPALNELCSREWDQGNAHFPATSCQVVELRCASEAVNVIPDELYARFNFRYSTEWSYSDLQNAVQEVLDKHALRYELAWHLSGEPFLTGPGRLIEATCAAVAAESGRDPELSTGGGTSDGRFIAPSGADVVELGPVNASIHKPDECVDVAELAMLCRMYERLLAELLPAAES